MIDSVQIVSTVSSISHTCFTFSSIHLIKLIGYLESCLLRIIKMTYLYCRLLSVFVCSVREKSFDSSLQMLREEPMKYSNRNFDKLHVKKTFIDIKWSCMWSSNSNTGRREKDRRFNREVLCDRSSIYWRSKSERNSYASSITYFIEESKSDAITILND